VVFMMNPDIPNAPEVEITLPTTSTSTSDLLSNIIPMGIIPLANANSVPDILQTETTLPATPTSMEYRDNHKQERDTTTYRSSQPNPLKRKLMDEEIKGLDEDDENTDCVITWEEEKEILKILYELISVEEVSNRIIFAYYSSTMFVVSSEGVAIPIQRNCVGLSGTLRTFLDVDNSKPELKVDVDTPTLRFVTRFLEHRNGVAPGYVVEKPLRSEHFLENFTTDEGTQDAVFVDDLDQELLFSTLQAANYLDIPPLIDLGCAKIASMIKGKTPEQIRTTFHIVNDFTPEEEEAVRQENRWAEES